VNSIIAIARALSNVEHPSERATKLDALRRIWFAIDDATWEMWNTFGHMDNEAVVTAAFESLSANDRVTWRWMAELAVAPAIPEPKESFPELFEQLLAGRLPGDRLAERDVMTGIYWRMHPITPGEVIVDVGAHTGQFTAVAAIKTGPTGTVLAFEPNNRNAAHLHNTVRNLANVILYPVALGATRGKVTMSFGSATVSHRAASHHDGDVGVKVDVEVFPLDEIWPSTINRCDLIKLDAESAECDILLGAKQTIERYRPDMVIEVEDGAAMAPILKDMGYVVWGGEGPNDQMRLGCMPGFGMWWCFPKERQP
jgi:FkbM family methyltransferase